MLGIGLLRRRPWARTPAAAVLGGYVLLGWSVAAMGWNMLRSGAPDASVGLAEGATAIASAGAGYAAALYRPLFRRAAAAAGGTDVPAPDSVAVARARATVGSGPGA